MPVELATLIEELRSADPGARKAAAEQLAQRGEEAQAAAVPLVEACASDEATRDAATAALESLGPPADSDVAALTMLLARPKLDVAYWAATLLGRLHGGAATATTALAQALASHKELAVRERAAWALAQIGPAAAAAVDVLKTAASANNARLANLAREALKQIQG